MRKRIELPEIPPDERTASVKALMDASERLAEWVQQLEETIGQLRDEVAVLKGEKKRPVFKPSKLDERACQDEDPQKTQSDKRPGSSSRSKTQALEIHEEKIIPPERSRTWFVTSPRIGYASRIDQLTARGLSPRKIHNLDGCSCIANSQF